MKRRLCQGVALFAVLAAFALLNACGSKNVPNDSLEEAAMEDSYMDESYMSESYADAAYPDAAEAEAPAAAPMGEAETGGGLDVTLQSGTIDPTKQKIIRDAILSLETKTFEDTVTQLSQKAIALGGYLEGSSSEDNGSSRGRSIQMTFRIPYQNFDAYLESTRASGKVREERIVTEDVSNVYFDSQARRNSLQIKLERLESIMAASATLEDVLRLETEIADTRYEIERLQGSLNSIDSLVRYSTVSLTVYEWIDSVPAISEEDPGFGERVRIAFGNTGYAFVSFVQGFVIVLIYLSPMLIIAAIAVPLILFFARKRKAKRKPFGMPPTPAQRTNESPDMRPTDGNDDV